jgi:hypothetical protein
LSCPVSTRPAFLLWRVFFAYKNIRPAIAGTDASRLEIGDACATGGALSLVPSYFFGVGLFGFCSGFLTVSFLFMAFTSLSDFPMSLETCEGHIPELPGGVPPENPMNVPHRMSPS